MPILVIGKRYITRDSGEVMVVSDTHDKDDPYPYRGDNDQWYSRAGRINKYAKHNQDIVGEIL